MQLCGQIGMMISSWEWAESSPPAQLQPDSICVHSINCTVLSSCCFYGMFHNRRSRDSLICLHIPAFIYKYSSWYKENYTQNMWKTTFFKRKKKKPWETLADPASKGRKPDCLGNAVGMQSTSLCFVCSARLVLFSLVLRNQGRWNMLIKLGSKTAGVLNRSQEATHSPWGRLWPC